MTAGSKDDLLDAYVGQYVSWQTALFDYRKGDTSLLELKRKTKRVNRWRKSLLRRGITVKELDACAVEAAVLLAHYYEQHR